MIPTLLRPYLVPNIILDFLPYPKKHLAVRIFLVKETITENFMDTHKNQFRQISIFEDQLHPTI